MSRSKNYLTLSLLLCGSVLLMFVHFYFFHGGYLGYDELEYCKLASQVINGDFSHGTNLYAFRYIAYLPLALIYKIFGSSDFSNTLITVIYLIFLLILLLNMIGELGFWTKAIAVLFLIWSPMHLLYLEKPMPDVITELGFLLCFYSYYRMRFDNILSKFTLGFIFILGAIITFFAKETFLIFYPYFLILFIKDLIKKEHLVFWRLVIIGLTSFLILYFTVNGLIFGNPLERIDSIFFNRYISECTYDLQPFKVLLDRISYKLWFDFIRFGFLLPLIFLPMLWRPFQNKKSVKFIILSWIGLLLLSNFMTISYTSYVPLCNDTRHYLFLLPLGTIIWAYGISNFSIFKITDKIWMIVVLAIQWYISHINNYENTWMLYAPIIISILIHHIYRNKIILFLGIVLGLTPVFTQNIHYNLKVNHKEQKKLIDYVLTLPETKKLIITDGANATIGNFYAKYDIENVCFMSFMDFEKNQEEYLNKYIIMNGMTMYHSKQQWETLPDFAKSAFEKLPKLYENKSGVVYKMASDSIQ